MGTLELKSNIHTIVDSIQNEQLLRTVYDFLKLREGQQTGKIWDSLSVDEQNEVLLSYEESEDENNLLEVSALFKKT